MLDGLSKESIEKDAQIKRQNEQIAELMKKLEKKLSETSNKGSSDEDSGKESNRDEDSNDGCVLKRGSMLDLMSIEQIQSVIATIVKAQLREGNCKTNLYTKAYTKRIDLLRLPHA